MLWKLCLLLNAVIQASGANLGGQQTNFQFDLSDIDSFVGVVAFQVAGLALYWRKQSLLQPQTKAYQKHTVSDTLLACQKRLAMNESNLSTARWAASWRLQTRASNYLSTFEWHTKQFFSSMSLNNVLFVATTFTHAHFFASPKSTIVNSYTEHS